MIETDYLKKLLITSRKSVKLEDLAERLDISHDAVVGILTQAGFVTPKNNPKIQLSGNQVDYIAIAYSASVKNYFKKAAGSYKNLSPLKAVLLTDNLARFVHDSERLSIDDLLNSEIDLELILEFFYELIYARPESPISRQNPIYYVLREIKFKRSVSKINNTLSTLSVDKQNHNHVYPDEEDDSKRLANNIIRFSFVSNMFREASINTLNYFKLLKWKRNIFSLKI